MPDLAPPQPLTTHLPLIDSAPPERSHGTRASMAVVIALMLVYAGLFGWLSLDRYYAYQMHALDMGNMGQAAWNTIHGHPFYFTNMRLPYAIEAWGTTTRLSFHVEFLFPIISLVYLIYPHPESLLILQTLALALGALPIYFLARDMLGSAWLAVVFAGTYLLFPSLEAINLYEFHPVALATPLLLFAFWFAYRRQYLLFFVFALAAMGTKEQIGLIVAMFGLYIAGVYRDRRPGLLAIAIGVFWSLFAVFVIERHFRAPGTLSYFHTRYGYLGHGIHGALHTILTNPGIFFQTAFTWAKLGYVERMLAPAGYLSLLSPAGLLLGAPSWALTLLTTQVSMFTGLGDNAAELIAVVMIAAVLGGRRLINWLEYLARRRTVLLVLGAFLLVISVSNQRVNGYTPFGGFYQVFPIGHHQKIANKFVAMVPPDVPVSTQDQLDPHLSSRHYLYLFEDTGRRPDPSLVPANYILLDASAPTYPLPSYQLHDYARQYIDRPGWGIAAANDGLILIKRGAAAKLPPRSFYTFLVGKPAEIQHRLSGRIGNMQLLGYSREETDLPNHRIPNLAYSFFLRPLRKMNHNLQPYVYETSHGALADCSPNTLGLAWLPTRRWTPGHTYKVALQPLETTWQTPGRLQLWVSFQPAESGAPQKCAALWSQHGHLWPIGTLDVQF